MKGLDPRFALTSFDSFNPRLSFDTPYNLTRTSGATLTNLPFSTPLTTLSDYQITYIGSTQITQGGIRSKPLKPPVLSCA